MTQSDRERGLGLCIVGLGAWGAKLLRAFSSVRGTRIASLCDLDPERLAAAARHAPKAVLGADPCAAIRADGVDAVVLATPPGEHANQTLFALSLGKHVFVEKPMTTLARDAVRVERLAARSRAKVMVGHILRYHPAFQEFRALVSRGRIGPVISVHAVRLGAGPIHDDTQAWWALAPHDVSALRALLDSEPTSIRMGLGPPLPGAHRPVQAALTFPRGITATIAVSARSTRKTRRIVVVGTRATAVFDDTEATHKIRIHPLGFDSLRFGKNEREPAQRIFVPGDEPLVAEADHFVRAILDGTPIATDAAEGRAVVTVLEAGVQSLCSSSAPVSIGNPERDARFSAREMDATESR